jgi:hypothetical protein
VRRRAGEGCDAGQEHGVGREHEVGGSGVRVVGRGREERTVEGLDVQRAVVHEAQGHKKDEWQDSCGRRDGSQQWN